MNYLIFNDSPIKLSHLEIQVSDLLSAVQNTNNKLKNICFESRKMKADIFNIMDFRNLSGLVGEAFVTELGTLNGFLIKNPSLDGYPDLLQVSNQDMKNYFKKCGYDEFKKFKYGGIEIKNTFGTKKSNADLIMGDQRIGYINNKLDWKAHHQETNNLVALLSDYIQGIPQIVALCYSDTLVKSDWQDKQNPKAGSAMTSFSTIKKTGEQKLRSGLKLCLNDPKYLTFFNKE